MSDDLVKRLREDAGHVLNQSDYVGSPDYSSGLMEKAADRIARLEAALRPFADCADELDPKLSDDEWASARLLVSDYRRARAAIAGTPRPVNPDRRPVPVLDHVFPSMGECARALGVTVPAVAYYLDHGGARSKRNFEYLYRKYLERKNK